MQSECLAYLATLAINSIDSVVTDPPYELNFMGRDWDRSGIANQVELWRAVYRVLKPGAHLLAFGGTRTAHRMVCAIEDAGFQIRDSLHWMYGSGFPKSRDISKEIDKVAGAERAVVGSGRTGGGARLTMEAGHVAHSGNIAGDYAITAPATDLAQQWAGWGTALKPAHEPICLARKPIARTVAATIAAYGTGGINVEACRVGSDVIRSSGESSLYLQQKCKDYGIRKYSRGMPGADYAASEHIGRWPPNVLLIHSATCNGVCAPDCPVAALGASRFYPILNYEPEYDNPARYCAKASRRERGAANHHPTVKPVALCRWLVRLVTPPGGTVLDPFAGSGSVGVACVLEGFNYIGCDQDAEYVEIANRRIAATQPALMGV